ncbi:WhiB family transcriptional regulator [Streptacidiphilus cavernicola]|uniref:WhiB family transcriptional regulator n=1 Tax=Streptacidiphilus cavernicola TaxID=3342716 RepID=A0ABV6VZ10_9ACTN
MTAAWVQLQDALAETDNRLVPCRNDDPELWFASKKLERKRALALCGGCPVRDLCRTAGRQGREKGSWGESQAQRSKAGFAPAKS